MRQRTAVRHRAVDRPAGRGAGRRDGQRDPQRGLAVMLEPAEFLGPAGAQQLGVADFVDDVREDVAVLLGRLGQFPDFRHHRARPLDQLVGRGNAEAADRGGRHAKTSLASRRRHGSVRVPGGGGDNWKRAKGGGMAVRWFCGDGVAIGFGNGDLRRRRDPRSPSRPPSARNSRMQTRRRSAFRYGREDDFTDLPSAATAALPFGQRFDGPMPRWRRRDRRCSRLARRSGRAVMGRRRREGYQRPHRDAPMSWGWGSPFGEAAASVKYCRSRNCGRHRHRRNRNNYLSSAGLVPAIHADLSEA